MMSSLTSFNNFFTTPPGSSMAFRVAKSPNLTLNYFACIDHTFCQFKRQIMANMLINIRIQTSILKFSEINIMPFTATMHSSPSNKNIIAY